MTARSYASRTSGGVGDELEADKADSPQKRGSSEELGTSPRPRNLLSTYRHARKCVASRRRATAAQARKKESPFVGIEYNSRESWLQQEKKWLQEDEVYLYERTEDLRHSSVMKKLAEQSASDQDLYEKRLFFGPHSLKLKASKAAKCAKASGRGSPSPREVANTEMPRPQGRRSTPQDGGRRSVGPPEYRSAANAMKRLQQELEISQKSLSNSRNASKLSWKGMRPRPLQSAQANAQPRDGASSWQ